VKIAQSGTEYSFSDAGKSVKIFLHAFGALPGVRTLKFFSGRTPDLHELHVIFMPVE
jgi:hypothetical protein